MPGKHKAIPSFFTKACAVVLSLALAATMCPIVGFAEEPSQADAVAYEGALAEQPSAGDS